MKLNFGCGFNKRADFVNVDKYDTCHPDLQADLETFPWPFESNIADEVLFNHSLEHMGADTNVFLEIIKELYRISKPGAVIQINVPHPRHDHFIGDPTHVRVVTPQMLSLFSKRLNLHWKSIGAANSPLALYLGVDFEIKAVVRTLEPKYLTLLQNKTISEQELAEFINERNNVVSEFKITLEVVK